MNRGWKQYEFNQVMDGDDFFVSYNPDTTAAFGAISLFAGDGVGEETALCIDGKYFILNGDFRKEYEDAIDNVDHCRAIYDKNKAEHDSSWTSF